MRKIFLICGFVFLLVGSGFVRAQQQEEYKALMLVLNEKSIDARVKLGEEFLQKSPSSAYVPNVRDRLVRDYNEKSNSAKVIEHGEPLDSKDGVILTFLADAYGDRKNDGKCIDTAQKAIQALNGAQRPENIAERDWTTQKNSLVAHNQYLIGTVYFSQARRKSGAEKTDLLAKSRQILMAAVKISPRDDRAYYQLGLTLADMGEGTDACDALAKAVVIGGSMKPLAESELERIYVHYNRSKVGLDKVLAKARASLK